MSKQRLPLITLVLTFSAAEGFILTVIPGDVRTVDVHVRRLREKVEPNASDPKYIQTKWGVGYYFGQN